MTAMTTTTTTLRARLGALTVGRASPKRKRRRQLTPPPENLQHPLPPRPEFTGFADSQTRAMGRVPQPNGMHLPLPRSDTGYFHKSPAPFGSVDQNDILRPEETYEHLMWREDLDDPERRRHSNIKAFYSSIMAASQGHPASGHYMLESFQLGCFIFSLTRFPYTEIKNISRYIAVMGQFEGMLRDLQDVTTIQRADIDLLRVMLASITRFHFYLQPDREPEECSAMTGLEREFQVYKTGETLRMWEFQLAEYTIIEDEAPNSVDWPSVLAGLWDVWKSVSGIRHHYYEMVVQTLKMANSDWMIPQSPPTENPSVEDQSDDYTVC